MTQNQFLTLDRKTLRLWWNLSYVNKKCKDALRLLLLDKQPVYLTLCVPMMSYLATRLWKYHIWVYCFWTAENKAMTYITKWKRITFSIQHSIQKSLLKYVEVCEVSLSKIEFFQKPLVLKRLRLHMYKQDVFFCP